MYRVGSVPLQVVVPLHNFNQVECLHTTPVHSWGLQSSSFSNPRLIWTQVTPTAHCIWFSRTFSHSYSLQHMLIFHFFSHTYTHHHTHNFHYSLTTDAFIHILAEHPLALPTIVRTTTIALSLLRYSHSKCGTTAQLQSGGGSGHHSSALVGPSIQLGL